jgi:hypothetical protein
MTKEESKNNAAIKTKGGRPQKGIKRNNFLNVRMTATERLLIEGKAKKAGLTPSEWFRQAAKSAQVAPRLSAADVNHLNMLAGLANNLNQLTRLAHIKGIDYIARQCISLLDAITGIINKLFSDGRKADQR